MRCVVLRGDLGISTDGDNQPIVTDHHSTILDHFDLQNHANT
jgi:hypothetical protein